MTENIYSEKRMEEKGMVLTEDGVVACKHCAKELRFNSGNPAVYHTDECPSKPKITYMGSE